MLALLHSYFRIPFLESTVSSGVFYQQSWFIVFLVISLVTSLIVLFVLRNKFSIKKFEAYSEYKTHLSKLRLLTVLFIVGLPAIEWSQASFIEGHIARWGLIAIEEIVLVIFLGASLIKRINAIFINVYSVLGTSAIISLLIYRTFLDNMETVYMLEVIVAMAYTAIVFNNIKHQLVQLLIVDVIFVYLFLTTENKILDVLIFVSAFMSIQIYGLLFHLFQIHKLEKNSFSERILNTYDKLVIVYNIQGEVVYVNPYLKSFVGKRDEELLVNEWYKVRHCSKERTQQIKLSVRQQILEQLTIDELNEEIFSESKQSMRTVNWTFQVMDNSYLMAIGNDITRLLQNQKRIVELSSIAETVTNGIAITEPDGTIKWVNDSYIEITGYTFDELIGQIPLTFFKIPDSFRLEYDGMFENGPIFNKPVTICQYHKDGHEVWLLLHLTPLYSTEGNLEKIITVVTDITENKKKDIEFQKLSLIAQHTQNPILITDAEFKINWINDSFTSHLAYSLLDIEGKEPGNLLFQESVNSDLYETFVSEIESGMKAKGDFEIYRKDGSSVWMNVTVDPIHDSQGNITQFICLMQNIQEIKDYQAIIEEKNKDITDSISYAQRIQDALLPNLKLVKQNLPKHFVLYRPKDIVSGDFYYIEMYQQKVFIGIADCTGHGVPGAMMTSIGAAALNNAILDRKISNPAKILSHVDGYLKASLSTSKEGLNDGMDIGLIVLNIATSEIEYCGAKRPLLIVDEDNNQTIIPGIKRSIGQFVMGDEFKFKTTTISVSEPLSIYCFSDGIPDQFGGPNGKKIYQKTLNDLLAQNSGLPMKEQHQKLEDFVDSWQGSTAQTDDMVLFGGKISSKYFEKLKRFLASEA